MFGPLSFPSLNENSIESASNNQYKETSCMLCDEEFVLERQKSVFLQHLLLNHSVLISDVNKIACLERYIEHWREKLRNIKLEELGIEQSIDIGKIKDSDLLDIGDNEHIHEFLTKGRKIFVFSGKLPEDLELRNTLQTKRLELVLDQQRQEREIADYCRECLFCHTDIIGTVADYLNHLSGKHNLFLGRPQNLVFVDQLINTIENKLENLQCLYCEKIFKDRNVLKEHMRKKLHKRINPKNTEYDRFYIINYLEMGKTWKHLENIKENESPDSDGSDSDWSDWQEQMQLQIVCLFCKNNSISWDDTLDHMKIEHSFDYKEYTFDLDFYQQVKLVNYIRRQIHRLSCIKCDFTADSLESLLAHMNNEYHFTLPNKSLWDQPEYFFPTYENDLFLCQIDDPGKSETSSVTGCDITHEEQLFVK